MCQHGKLDYDDFGHDVSRFNTTSGIRGNRKETKETPLRVGLLYHDEHENDVQ